MAVDARIYRNLGHDAPPRMAPYPSTASSPSLRSPEPLLVQAPPPTPPAQYDTAGDMDSGNVKVVVRVRKFLKREVERGAKCLVKMDPVTQETRLCPPDALDKANAAAKTRKVADDKKFTFDHSFCSFDEGDDDYTTQEDVYRSFGEGFLDHNFNGYHTCIFAYGQTGSGKSYTMMGTPEQPGLIPRTCEALFRRIEGEPSQDVTYNVHVSYFEVYNEHVRDLLVAQAAGKPPSYLKIRESPQEGVYVQGLMDAPVKSYADIQQLMKIGDQNRTTAATKMNDTSSRSHAVFTIHLKSIQHSTKTSDTIERSARMRLVDLAGSERAKATEARGQRLVEGGKINQSLTTLGRVIAALSDPRRQQGRPGTPDRSRAGTPTGSPRKAAKLEIVPYRDSVLTWLLKDSLGGNSKTAMVACISPCDYDETLSTLRYADQAKKIRTRAHTNLNTVSAAQRDAQIASMAAQIAQLQATINSQNQRHKALEYERRAKEAREQIQLEENEALLDYQKQVAKMQRLMEEGKAVSEARIRALTREVEDLREQVPRLEEDKANLKRHLDLALSSLRDPIVLPRFGGEDVVEEDADEGVKDMREEEGEATAGAEKTDRGIDIYEDGGESGEETAVEGEDVSWHMDLQAEAEAMLKELGLFKRKIGDDRQRFGLSGPFASLDINRYS